MNLTFPIDLYQFIYLKNIIVSIILCIILLFNYDFYFSLVRIINYFSLLSWINIEEHEDILSL